MTRQRIRILILTGLLSIGGTLVLQLIWLQQAIDLGEREFNDRVFIALTEVVDEIQSMRGDSALVEPVRQQASNFFVANLNDTLHPYLLESLLRSSFERAALNAPFDYAIYDCFSDSIVYGGRVGGANPEDSRPPRFEQDGHYFGIRFPDRRADILMSLDRWILASVLQLLVLGTFVFAVVLVLRQKRLSEIQEDFINNMTHEFKTPIASIASGAQLLLRDEIGQLPESRSRYLHLILAENNRMQRQVEKVMDMATLGKAVDQITKTALSAVDWVREGTDAFLPQIQQLGGQLNVRLPEDASLGAHRLSGDRTHLDGVLSNLLDNAVRYRGDAPPNIEVTLQLKVGKQSKWALTVTDAGIGIPKGHIQRVFERFHRVPTGDRHDVKGFGLGLHYAKTIVAAHGGHIDCISQEGKGATFTVQLPAHV